jgi:toxin ParE1/3/4
MSARRFPVVLSPEAQDDYASIHAYTLRQWDESQWAVYEAALLRAFDALGDNPSLGRAQDDLRPGLRSLPVEQHIIFYEVRNDTIRVARLLHHSRNARNLLRS